MSNHLVVLRASVARLHDTVEPLTTDQLGQSAYPTKWTIADVLSHLGSGAVIMERRLEDSLAGRDMPADFAKSVWDAWNAKGSQAQAADALVADRRLVDRLQAVGADERSRLHFSFGPINVDFDGFIGLRLNEHALHSWDIAEAFDSGATLAPDATNVVIDNLEMTARFSGKPTGVEHTVHVHTSEPERRFAITLSADAVSLAADADGHAPDVELTAEAFIRLIYGRLDPDHTPPSARGENLDGLRRTFQGI